jgi:putative hemolysin
MFEIWLLLGGIVACLFFSGFFSGAESGMMLADPLRLQHRADRGDSRARLILAMKQNPDHLIGTILVGNNIVNVSAAVLTNRLLGNWMEPYMATLVATLSLTVIMLITSEILPKMIFQSRPEELSRHVVPWLRVLGWILHPILLVVNAISGVLVWVLGGQKKERGTLTREDINLLADVGMEQGAINARAYALIGSVLAFAKTTAREIMTPLVDVIGLEDDAVVEDVVRVIEKTGFSRIPIYRNHAHTMTGYISAFDLKQSRRTAGIGEFVRPAVFIPESKCIDTLLIEMRQKRLPMVFVVDEWGGAAGIITHEDIAEHVVGQILDKGEKMELEMQEVSPGEYLADGWTDVDKVEQILRIRIEKKGFETIGGFLEHIMQHIPAVDESVVYEGYRFLIEEADSTRIFRVRIKQAGSKKRIRTNQAKEKKLPRPESNGKKNETEQNQK